MPYNPAEPRDGHGRWTTGGTGSRRDPASILYPNLPLTADDIAYNGGYHDIVVQWIQDSLGKENVTCIKSVPITTIDGSTTAIPDLVCQSPADGSLAFMEVKTGANPSFTPNQNRVYSMAQLDKHVYSSTDKLAPFGVPQGTPLPPTDVIVAYAPGPGKTMKYKMPFKGFRK